MPADEITRQDEKKAWTAPELVSLDLGGGDVENAAGSNLDAGDNFES